MTSVKDIPITAEPSRRRFLQGSLLTGAAALAGPALLSACGDGDIVSALKPSRIRVLGDGLSFLGTPRFTVNDGSARLWVDQLAGRYGLTLSAADGFAAGNATVADISVQITAAGTPGSNDLFVINAPMQDILPRLPTQPPPPLPARRWPTRCAV